MKFLFRVHVNFILITVGALFLVIAPGLASEVNPTIRVLVAQSSSNIRVEVKGGYQVIDAKSKEVLSDSKYLPNVNLRLDGSSILLAGVRFDESIILRSDDDGDLKIDGKPYRGFVVIHNFSDKTVAVVNHIQLESYLHGVLFHEVGAWWPMEALKAQAVASRTYALNQMKERSRLKFDVRDNQYSQMYGGMAAERSRSNDAVDSTRGEILTYGSKIFPSFYHATCGGVTRDATELWEIDIPPLDGKARCTYCWFSPHYSWQAKMSLLEVQSILEEHGVSVGSLYEFKVLDTSPSDRALTILAKGSSGEQVLSAKNFRLWAGPTFIRSENFDAEISGGRIKFRGNGWGHGVGMCQWGALGQSIIRKTYDEILYFYYPESSLSNVYK